MVSFFRVFAKPQIDLVQVMRSKTNSAFKINFFLFVGRLHLSIQENNFLFFIFFVSIRSRDPTIPLPLTKNKSLNGNQKRRRSSISTCNIGFGWRFIGYKSTICSSSSKLCDNFISWTGLHIIYKISLCKHIQ